MNWLVLIQILLWLLQFLRTRQNLSVREKAKLRKALSLMREIAIVADRDCGVQPDEEYSLPQMLKDAKKEGFGV